MKMIVFSLLQIFDDFYYCPYHNYCKKDYESPSEDFSGVLILLWSFALIFHDL